MKMTNSALTEVYIEIEGRYKSRKGQYFSCNENFGVK
jgi:hypothetical protein